MEKLSVEKKLILPNGEFPSIFVATFFDVSSKN
jgi:hypothetical protein